MLKKLVKRRRRTRSKLRGIHFKINQAFSDRDEKIRDSLFRDLPARPSD